MKISKTQLKQIIKEELAVILTNEEAGELFGEAVEAELEEKKGIKNPGKYIDGPRTKAGIDDDGDGTPNKADSHPKDGARNESMIQEDLGQLLGLVTDNPQELMIVLKALGLSAANVGGAAAVGLAISRAIDLMRDGMAPQEAGEKAREDVKQAGGKI